jgi:hypothetical protein
MGCICCKKKNDLNDESSVGKVKKSIAKVPE